MGLLSEKTWGEIFDHSKDDYPAECCGVVISDQNGQTRVYRCENIQNKLHRIDPKTHPRTSKTAYRMDDMQVNRIMMETEKSGGNLVAFYHSHIDCDAYFSDEDKSAATFFGEPAYPGVNYPVVSVVDREIRGQKIFHWDESIRDFVEWEAG